MLPPYCPSCRTSVDPRLELEREADWGHSAWFLWVGPESVSQRPEVEGVVSPPSPGSRRGSHGGLQEAVAGVGRQSSEGTTFPSSLDHPVNTRSRSRPKQAVLDCTPVTRHGCPDLRKRRSEASLGGRLDSLRAPCVVVGIESRRLRCKQPSLLPSGPALRSERRLDQGPTMALMTLGVRKAAPTFAMYRLEASSPVPNAILAG